MATNKVYCSYEEIIDMNTVDGTVTAIGIHTPTGTTPHKMFPGLFQQYRKWRYLGCSVVGANAAQLPIDPLGVSYEAGDDNASMMAPGDVFNPIMFHGCHGDDLGAILNQLYVSDNHFSDSLNYIVATENDDQNIELMRGLYYKALTDRTWKKFGIQNGFRLRGLHPLVYSVATNHQITPSILGGNEITVQDADGDLSIDGGVPMVFDQTGDQNGYLRYARDRQFFTPRLVGLGAMDTRLPQIPIGSDIPVSEDSYASCQSVLQNVRNYATMPKIFMGVILLPESQRVKQFLRIVIKHKFVFYSFRGASMADNILGSPSFFDDRRLTEETETEYGKSQDDSMFDGEGGGDPDPDPPVPEPTEYEIVRYTGVDNVSNFTCWLQSVVSPVGGDSIIEGTSKTNSTLPATVNLEAGSYYLYVSFSYTSSNVVYVNGDKYTPTVTYVGDAQVKLAQIPFTLNEDKTFTIAVKAAE